MYTSSLLGVTLTWEFRFGEEENLFLAFDPDNNIDNTTNRMQRSPSWAANWIAASQEIPRISRNPKVHYRTVLT
jgi:hypothetical protein